MNRVIYTPTTCRNRRLIFDVETNGLIPKNNKLEPSPKIEDYPYILQLSFAVYDTYERKILYKYNSYVNVPESVEISDFITNLTGITREKCNQGKKIVDILNVFYQAYISCHGLIAHNMEFDEKMIYIEIERNKHDIIKKAPYCLTIFNPVYEKINNIERFCTMRKSIALCNIEMKMPEKPKKPEKPERPRTRAYTLKLEQIRKEMEEKEKQLPSKEKKTMKKFPKLSELFSKLFKNETLPENMHNSMIDVLVCLRCYIKMQHNYDDTSLLSFMSIETN